MAAGDVAEVAGLSAGPVPIVGAVFPIVTCVVILVYGAANDLKAFVEIKATITSTNADNAIIGIVLLYFLDKLNFNM